MSENSQQTTSQNRLWKIRTFDDDSHGMVGTTFTTVAESESEAIEELESRDLWEVRVDTTEHGWTWVSVWARDVEDACELAVSKEERYLHATDTNRVELSDNIRRESVVYDVE